MESARTSVGAWSRKIWILVATLTVIGLLGILVDFVAFFAILGPLTGGCGGLGGLGFFLMVLAAVLVLIYIGLAGGLATTGLILFWRRSRWGPRLLIPSNLLSMAFFFWSPVNPGQVDWATVLVLLGAAPAIATILLFWLLSRDTVRLFTAELVVLGLLALPLVSAYAYGIGTDVNAALAAPPPHIAASAGCGGSGPPPPATTP